MKISLFIYLLLLLSASPANSQDTIESIYHLSKIPEEGLRLDKGWKFKVGDNPEWARQDYNDKAWTSIDPTLELHHLSELREAGIGWFRLKMEVDSSLLGEMLSMVVSTMGASEIYLNGQLQYKFGKVSRDYEEEETRFFTNHLSSLKLGQQRSQVIAGRYSFHKRNLYLKFTFARPVIRLVLKETNQAFDDQIKEDGFESTLRSIRVSFYLPLGFLLVFLFYSFRPQKEYLYSGIFCFCFFGAILIHKFAELESITVSQVNFLLLATQVLYILGTLSFIYGAYILYKQKRSWVFYVLVLYGLLIIPFYFISYDWSGLFNLCFLPLINFEFLRLNLQAVRRHRPGAWILLITSLLLVLTLFCLVWLNFIEKDKLSALVQSISFIIPGIGLSLFFAGEFARTGSALQLRVSEVEQLSKKMIEKEKEKQQILAEQNETLEKQVRARTTELSQSLKDLKETQNQLIQREKMASLGELIAGIAHEIENPLNFVNNFSEVNIELADELKKGLNNSHFPVEERNNLVEIVNDITQNQEKINHHGKRADAIVKGMLLHSRSGTGQKESANINTIAHECLRLSYNAIRAKDKSFQAHIQINFDESMSEFPIIQEDIVRVFVNLFNNAFYAVNEKRKLRGESYEPAVSVSTKKLIDKIEIKVKDNGMGISQKVIDKIYQPFFTTKPTGEGTGLGLSLSYDIITKEHGGTITAETKEGDFAEFVIQLPIVA